MIHPLVAPSGKTRPALVIAHPGHELRVHGWLERARPIVCVLTDGAGRTRRSRLDSTTGVLTAAGAKAGPIYGAMADQELYAFLLDRNHRPFISLLRELSAMFIREQIDYVVGDAEEGYNPAHDICRLLINGAVAVATAARSSAVTNFEFDLVGPPNQCPAELRSASIWLELDEEAWNRKISTARKYPELTGEVEAALAGAGSTGLVENPDLVAYGRWDLKAGTAADFKVECLRYVQTMPRSANGAQPKPFYEMYGEKKVRDGHYQHVVRYRDHVRPLAEAIQAHVKASALIRA